MTGRRFVFAWIGILLLLYGGPSFGDELLIFGNQYKPPKVYLDNDTPRGILVDIMKYVEQETDHSFNIQLWPWKRSYKMAENSNGGIIGLSMTQQRLEIFDYSDVMFYDDMMLVVLKGHEFPFEKLEDLKGKRVGVRRGARYGDEFVRGKEKIFQVDEDGDAIQRLKKLLMKRIDVALIGPGKAGVNQIIKADPALLKKKDEFVLLTKPFKRDPNYLGFAKSLNMREFLKEFNQVLQKGYRNGTIQKIINKHSG